MPHRKKLIEVALPLEAINDASAYDKLPGIGSHPRGLHQWWARLPLPTARAMLFASLVDDPAFDPQFADVSEEEQDVERERLFSIIRSLLKKRARDEPEVFDKALAEIVRATDGKMPTVVDPFSGGGSIPLEAQRLGLDVHASDLNPIAVLIAKALVEVAPKFADRKPVNPESRQNDLLNWSKTAGLAEDVRYYSRKVFERAKDKMGHLYPPGPEQQAVIAWIWGRTVRCPNPACGAEMPLVTNFVLRTKKPRVWIEPRVDAKDKRVVFVIRTGEGKAPKAPKVEHGVDFHCLVCGELATGDYIKAQGEKKRIGMQLLALVTQGRGGKNYHNPDDRSEAVAFSEESSWRPDFVMSDHPQYMGPPKYGMTTFADLFTQRQLVALSTLSELIQEIHEEIAHDSRTSGDWNGREVEDAVHRHGDDSPQTYADAVVTFLGFILDRCADFNTSLCRWSPSNEKVMNVFGRQAIPMIWDFGEANIMGDSVGAWNTCAEYVADCIEVILAGSRRVGRARQQDAASAVLDEEGILVSTDPPYYDNIPYADISDFFYVWLRHTIGHIYPDILGTILVPKSRELVADIKRLGGEEEARSHFESGFRKAFALLREKLDPRFPMTVYYAFKQSDVQATERKSGDLTTGWETLLDALVSAGFQITATWPVRASQAWRMRTMGANALASYIVLSCRPRATSAVMASRREFVNSLRAELPEALARIQLGGVAPVDLAQASIGPGMAVYSRYRRVLEPNGEPLTVRTALQLINQALDAYLAEQEGHVDEETRFAVAWFEQSGFREGQYGVADVLARAKNTSVEGMQNAGVLTASAGKVKLRHWSELDPEWDPTTDRRLTAWEATHHLIERLNTHGENGAAMLLAKMSAELAGQARQLAYRLYSICERKGWAELARDYNALVISWSASQEQAMSIREDYQQGKLFE